jgi:glycosyltransferase involved in cell wall biosynthesis
MKIAIASLGRFHVLDLARELDALGTDTLFYSYLPKKRAGRFGLPGHCHRGLLLSLVAPILAWQHGARNIRPDLQLKAMAYAIDAAVIARLEPCDVFICMSGIYLEAARYARKRYGARIYLERGSRHILSQRNILKRHGAARLPSDFIIKRELAGYELADRISVPSSHVVESFCEQNPALESKLFVNPYGVDLEQFPQRDKVPPPDPATVIFVGGWSYQKGVDVLVEAIRRLDNVKLLHVGSIVDAPFPVGDSRFEHIDPVPQWQLKDYYSRAHVFVLPSRQDGFGMVMSQALASGLPVVSSTMTGGPDLRLSPALDDRIFVVEPEDVSGLAKALSQAIDVAGRSNNLLNPLEASDLARLTWRAYGERYLAELQQPGLSAPRADS